MTLTGFWSYQLGETPKAFYWRLHPFHCWVSSLRTAMSLPTMGTTLANKWSTTAISAAQTQQLTDGSVTWHQNGAFTIPKHSSSHFQVENARPERDYWWKALPQWNQPLAQGRRPSCYLVICNSTDSSQGSLLLCCNQSTVPPVPEFSSRVSKTCILPAQSLQKSTKGCFSISSYAAIPPRAADKGHSHRNWRIEMATRRLEPKSRRHRLFLLQLHVIEM